MKKCSRCGLCCTIELCAQGRRTDKKIKGNCKFLIHNKDETTSCKLVIENKINKDSIVFEQGCVFQENSPIQYEFYRSMILNNINKTID